MLNRESLSVRAVVGQADIQLIREHLHGIEVRFADELDSSYQADLVAEVPAANYLLPSRVLGAHGGGAIEIEAGDKRGLKTTEKVFQIELAISNLQVGAIRTDSERSRSRGSASTSDSTIA